MNEIEKLKEDNKKAWKLVEQLEKENSLLVTANKNSLFEISRLKAEGEPSQYIREIENLKRANKDLKLNNKSLRQVLVNQYGVTQSTMDKMIFEALKRNKNLSGD